MKNKKVVITKGKHRNKLGIIKETYLCEETEVPLFSVRLFPDELVATLKRYEFRLLKDWRDELLFDY